MQPQEGAPDIRRLEPEDLKVIHRALSAFANCPAYASPERYRAAMFADHFKNFIDGKCDVHLLIAKPFTFEDLMRAGTTKGTDGPDDRAKGVGQA